MPQSANRYTGKKKPKGKPVAVVSATGESQRENANARGYNYRWQKCCRLFLAENPLCMECAKHRHTTLATVVDHITPHRGDMVKFWDTGNWQALCKPCHDTKTGKGE